MRRSKRKSSALAKSKTSNASAASSAAATATGTTAVVEDISEDEYIEGADLSDNEEDLHGPCNVKPVGADVDPRLVH